MKMARAFRASFGKSHENISRDDFESNFNLEAPFGKVICVLKLVEIGAIFHF